MNGEQLLRAHEQYLSRLAEKIARRYHANWLVEDLKQEGAIALLAAAKRYAPDGEADLLSCASGAVKSAMLDYAAENFLPLTVPPKRIRLLRKVAFICSQYDSAISEIHTTLSVSEKAALALYEEYHALFFPELLGEDVCSPVLPEEIYERKLLSAHLVQIIEKELTMRERSILLLHLGLEDNEQATFTELSILFNYNDPSAAQKVFERAVKKLRNKIDSGEYGAWVAAKDAIRQAQEEKIALPIG